MLFKVVYGTEIHVMNSKEFISYAKLEAFIKSVFKKLPSKYTLAYKDSDEDMICLLNDVDMKIVFESGINKVRIEIQECSEDFYEQTQEIYIEPEVVPEKQFEDPAVEVPVQKPQEVAPQISIPEVAPEIEVPEVAPEIVSESIFKNESSVSEIKSLDESINEKISQMIPDIIEKIKKEVMEESKIKQVKVEDKKEQVPSSSQVVHAHVTCDECGASPITGIRYKCVVCPNFDVCENCETKSNHTHPFLKIKHLHQTPIKIFAVIDDNDESLEINGERVPLPGLNQGIQDGLNLLTGLFGGRKPEECRESFRKCREHWGRFATHMKKNMREGQCPFQKKEEQKVEEKVEVKTEAKVQQKPEIKVQVTKVEPKVEVPKVEIKAVEKNTEPIITEDKKEIKTQPVPKKEIKTQPVPNKVSEELLVEAANYMSEILDVDFRKAYRFAVNYPGLTKEEIMMKYLEQ